MPEVEFVPLAELLRAGAEPLAPVAAVSPSPADIVGPASAAGHAAALRDARLFRARLADALDDAAARLLRDLAVDVLARELRLAPCDLTALVARYGRAGPVVVVRVAGADAGAALGVPTVVDASLQAGDAIVELSGGAVDARLGVRLAQLLESFS